MLITAKQSVTTSGISVDIVVPIVVVLIVARETRAAFIDGVVVVVAKLVAILAILLIFIGIIAIVPVAREESHDR